VCVSVCVCICVLDSVLAWTSSLTFPIVSHYVYCSLTAVCIVLSIPRSSGYRCQSSFCCCEQTKDKLPQTQQLCAAIRRRDAEPSKLEVVIFSLPVSLSCFVFALLSQPHILSCFVPRQPRCLPWSIRRRFDELAVTCHAWALTHNRI